MIAPYAHYFERMCNSLEVIVCETILQDMHYRMAIADDPWNLVDCFGTQSWTLPAVITFQDVESACAV